MTGTMDAMAPMVPRVVAGEATRQEAKRIQIFPSPFILFSHDSFHNIRAGIILACISDAEYDIHKFILTQSR